jgi:hypothetical protein
MTTDMKKTTLYLPPSLKFEVGRTAKRLEISEAEFMRRALQTAVDANRPRPRGGLFASGESIADHLDDYLVGFGES